MSRGRRLNPLEAMQEVAAVQALAARLTRARAQGPQAMQQLADELKETLQHQRSSDGFDEARQRMQARKALGNPIGQVQRLDYTEDGLESDSQFAVCATCKIPLNRITAFDGSDEEWVHTRNWQNYDHEPVPTIVPRTEVDTQCDFCGAYTKLSWAFHGDRIRLPDPRTGLVHDYGTVWSACDGCDPLIVAGDVTGLLDRLIEHSPVLRSVPGNLLEKRKAAEHNTIVWHMFLPTVNNRVYIGPRREPAKLNAKLMPKIRNGLLKFWRGADLRFYASGVTIPGEFVGEEEQFRARYPVATQVPPQAWQKHIDHLCAGIGVSNLFWISEKFTTLAIVAGKEFTEDPILELDALPAKFGLMLFETPIGEMKRPHGIADLRGFSWTLVPGGVWLNMYLQVEDADPEIDVATARAEMGYLVCPNAGSGISLSEPIQLGDNPRYQFMRTILATFFLMQQPGVTEENIAPVDKKFARAYKREHHREPEPVRLVDLRRAPRSHSNGSTHVGRPLEYRQYRKGHWKMQPYGPKRGLRKPKYISQYITGTDDMPFRPPQEKVYVVK